RPFTEADLCRGRPVLADHHVWPELYRLRNPHRFPAGTLSYTSGSCRQPRCRAPERPQRGRVKRNETSDGTSASLGFAGKPMKTTASDVLVETLLAWGVDTVFGIPGDAITGISRRSGNARTTFALSRCGMRRPQP